MSALVNEVESLRAEVEALKADNAALVQSIRAFHQAWKSGRDTLAMVAMLRLASGPRPGAALLEELRGLRVQAEMLQSVHAQVAEVAKLLDPEVMPDTWGLHAAAMKRMEELRVALAQVEALGLEVQLAREDVLEEADRRASAVHEGLKMDSDRARALKLDEHSQATTLGRVQGSFDVLFALRFMKSKP